MTATSAAIDYRGNFKMCCNVFSDAPGYDKYVVGNLIDRSFAELWYGDRMLADRDGHARADLSLSPICRQCTQARPEARQ